MKRALKVSEESGKTIQHRLAEFLFEYRATPHATTNVSPSELLQGRKLRTRFDLMRPDIQGHVTSKQATQKAYHDKHAKSRSLLPGASVSVRVYSGRERWIPGIIRAKLGPVTYSVEISQGRIIKRHIDQLRQRAGSTTTPEVVEEAQPVDYKYPDVPPDTPAVPAPQDQPATGRRYPDRIRHPPPRYTPDSKS